MVVHLSVLSNWTSVGVAVAHAVVLCDVRWLLLFARHCALVLLGVLDEERSKAAKSCPCVDESEIVWGVYELSILRPFSQLCRS